MNASYHDWKDFARRVALPYVQDADADADAMGADADRGFLLSCIAIAYLTVDRLERGDV